MDPSTASDGLCDKKCVSSHTQGECSHLPLVLFRATHSGSRNYSILQTSKVSRMGGSDYSMYPRDAQGTIDDMSVEDHLDADNRYPTPFLSFSTWRDLQPRIQEWKRRGVEDLTLWFMFTPLLREHVEVYRATGLASYFNLSEEVVRGHEEEYLFRQHLSSHCFLLENVPWGGKEAAVAAGPSDGKRDVQSEKSGAPTSVSVPIKSLGGSQPCENSLQQVAERMVTEAHGSCCELEARVLRDAFIRGELFTVADWEALPPRDRGEVLRKYPQTGRQLPQPARSWTLAGALKRLHGSVASFFRSLPSFRSSGADSVADQVGSLSNDAPRSGS